ncbi:MAG: D-aminoacylase [Atribacterota bacterium]|nr:D-aminoacylase [Atribacterota bacterium]
MEYDVILKNGRIVDGKGNPWYKGEIAIKDGRIEKVGSSITGSSLEKIDVENNIICPGFIDAHTHSDIVFFVDPTAQSKVRQGVTTEITGNCGTSGGPYDEKVKAKPPKAFNFTPYWHTIEEYIDALSQQPKTVNIAPLVGHGTIRAHTVGFEDRESTEEELSAMKKILEDGLSAGAFGMSTGLYFAPGSFAREDELVELGKIVAKYGSTFTSHIRDEGIHTVGFVPSVKEIIDIGKKSGASIQISHLKAFGPDVWGSSEEVLNIMEEARSNGIDVTCDQYPYVASGGGLPADVLPLSFLKGKNIEEVQKELKIPTVIEQLKDEVAYNIKLRGGAENQIIAEYPVDHSFEGRSLQDISDELGKDPAEVAMMMISNYYNANWVCYSMSPEDVENILKYPWTMTGSDGSSLSVEGPLSGGNPHPRNFGAFPHILREYVKEKKILKLEEAIRKMTSLPAQRFSISDRGCLDEGKWADIIVINEKDIIDASFKDPKRYPQGIPYVMVNGEWVIKKNEFTGRLPGRLARMK